MKKLQNCFTTPEQAQRLLEIGVPADSADCYYMAIGFDAKKYGYSDFPYFMTTNYVDKVHVVKGVNIPCWSVSRLMEIYDLCDKLQDTDTNWCNYSKIANYVEYIIHIFERGVKESVLDFSKLEE